MDKVEKILNTFFIGSHSPLPLLQGICDESILCTLLHSGRNMIRGRPVRIHCAVLESHGLHATCYIKFRDLPTYTISMTIPDGCDLGDMERYS